MEKLIKNVRIIVFILKILFFMWIWCARYKHTGRVCSGDYNGYEQLKTGSNYDSSFDYTYLGFTGFIMKIYVLIFLLQLFIKGTIAFYLGTDKNPFNLGEDTGKNNDDDNYTRMSGSYSTTTGDQESQKLQAPSSIF